MAIRLSKAQIAAMGPEYQALLKPKGKKRGGPSKAETRYGETLEARKRAGEIRDYKHQPCGLRLADKTFYHPDFLVILCDGRVEFHEVKGFLRDDSNVKIKVAAALFPWFVFRMIDSKTFDERRVWNECP